MKAYLVDYKPINNEEIESLKGTEWEQGKLIMRIGYNPKDKKNNLPLLFSLKYRAYNNDLHIGSIMVDYWYKIKFDYEKNPTNDLKSFLVKLILSFIEFVHIETLKNNISPKDELRTMKLEDVIEKLSKEILSEGQSQSLLRKPD